MVKSMTGFGRGQISAMGYQITCEIRGVNHRFFDAYIKMPRRYSVLEERIKELAKKYITRGRIEISINIEKTEESRRTIKVDNELVIAYYKSLKELADKLNISPDIKIIDLFRLPDAFSLEDIEEDINVVGQVMEESLLTAFQGFDNMRIREGQNISTDIIERNHLIASMVDQLEARSPVVAHEHQEKLRKRLLEFVPLESLDENRIIQEAAMFADKANVTEEIVRLKSHVKQLDELLRTGQAVGRKCDFLVQEMFREINTIASKANDLAMSQVVIDAKAELEKIREQLQNIE
ncbi:MAG: YicC/YloC family endoribonuclease [Syntrophomonadaceae bacterium]|jgi:uncharacterized protein (TIGR00255 family)